MATTTATKLRKPEPAIVHQGTNSSTSPTSPASPSRGIYPIPNIRRYSQGASENSGARRGSNGNSIYQPNNGEQKSAGSNQQTSSRREKAPKEPNTPNRLSQSWFTDAGSDLGSGRAGDAECDLEKGVKLDDLRALRAKKDARRKSTLSMVEAAGQQDARSSNSQPSTLHDEEEEEDDWDHTHPCFPHPNPHVPLDSQLYQTTKVIRIPRDYMINGDNTPAYSIVYPVILDPYVTEEQFRKIIDTVNEKLRLAFDPWNKWNWIDAAVGLTTLWFWEEIFPTYVKRRLREVELVLDQWNQTLAEQGAKLIALRRTGYISLDIQIPDPLREESEDGSIVGPLGQGVPTNGATANGTTENGTTITDERKRAMSNAGTIPRLTINGDYAK